MTQFWGSVFARKPQNKLHNKNFGKILSNFALEYFCVTSTHFEKNPFEVSSFVHSLRIIEISKVVTVIESWLFLVTEKKTIKLLISVA